MYLHGNDKIYMALLHHTESDPYFNTPNSPYMYSVASYQALEDSAYHFQRILAWRLLLRLVYGLGASREGVFLDRGPKWLMVLVDKGWG